MTELDRIDKKILDLLQVDSNVTNLALADRVGISAPACLRRVKRLRDERVIVGDVSLVDPLKLGVKLTALIEVTLERHSDEFKSSFIRRVMGDEAVTQCYMVTGETDAVLVVSIRGMEEYVEFTKRMFDSDARVLRYRTLFAMRRIKFETKVKP
jgi:Lrp/AsnC family leucine-responsive transcriptional regulator